MISLAEQQAFTGVSRARIVRLVGRRASELNGQLVDVLCFVPWTQTFAPSGSKVGRWRVRTVDGPGGEVLLLRETNLYHEEAAQSPSIRASPVLDVSLQYL